MAHEICHMFGLKHCIYYECLMNGTMSAQESARRANNTLCIVCLKKMAKNMKLPSVKVWFENMLSVSSELGFTVEASFYQHVLHV